MSPAISSTDEQTEQGLNNTEKLKSSPVHKANLGLFISIPIVLLIAILVIVLAVVFVRRRRRQPGEYQQDILDDSGIQNSPDGSVSVSNRLYDLGPEPSHYENQSSSPDKMVVHKNGNAHYKKSAANGNKGSNSSAFSNPLYEANKDFDTSDNQTSWHKTLPEADEISFSAGDMSHDNSSV